MFKSFLIFLGLFILILFGVYLFSSPEENTQLSARYSEYLSGALIRNTPSYDVEIDTELFIPEKTTSNEEFIEQINQQEAEGEGESNSNSKLFSYNQVNSDENSSAKGNFGTPSIGASSNSDSSLAGSSGSSCNGGLIYDPCIVLGEPIKASGGMDFGTARNYN